MMSVAEVLLNKIIDHAAPSVALQRSPADVAANLVEQVCCSVLQCVAVCCSVMRRVAA